MGLGSLGADRAAGLGSMDLGTGVGTAVTLNLWSVKPASQHSDSHVRPGLWDSEWSLQPALSQPRCVDSAVTGPREDPELEQSSREQP